MSDYLSVYGFTSQYVLSFGIPFDSYPKIRRKFYRDFTPQMSSIRTPELWVETVTDRHPETRSLNGTTRSQKNTNVTFSTVMGTVRL